MSFAQSFIQNVEKNNSNTMANTNIVSAITSSPPIQSPFRSSPFKRVKGLQSPLNKFSNQRSDKGPLLPSFEKYARVQSIESIEPVSIVSTAIIPKIKYKKPVVYKPVAVNASAKASTNSSSAQKKVKGKNIKNKHQRYYKKQQHKGGHYKQENKTENCVSTSIVEGAFKSLFPYPFFTIKQSALISSILDSNGGLLIEGTSDLVLVELAIIRSRTSFPNHIIIFLCQDEDECNIITDHWQSKLGSVGVSAHLQTLNCHVCICTSDFLLGRLNADPTLQSTISLVVIDQLTQDCMPSSLEVVLMKMKQDGIRLMLFSISYTNIQSISSWLQLNTLTPKEKKPLHSSLSLNISLYLVNLIKERLIQNKQQAILWLKKTFLFIELQSDIEYYNNLMGFECNSASEFLHELIKQALNENIAKDYQLTFVGKLMAKYYLECNSAVIIYQISNDASLFEIFRQLCSTDLGVSFAKGEKQQLYMIKTQPSVQEWFSGNKPKAQVKDISEKVMILLVARWNRVINTIPFVKQAQRISQSLFSKLECLIEVSLYKDMPNVLYHAYCLQRFLKLNNCCEEHQLKSLNEDIPSIEIEAKFDDGQMVLSFSSSTMDIIPGKCTVLCFTDRILSFTNKDYRELDYMTVEYGSEDKVVNVMLLHDNYLGFDVMQQFEVKLDKKFSKKAEVPIVKCNKLSTDMYNTQLQEWLSIYVE